MVALKNSTEDGTVILGKNSNRQPNEGHMIRHFPRQTHDPNTDMVKTTYLEIPQVEETYSILLSSPYWLWGGEMGANEFGVTIGNEAVFTKEPESEKGGLIGMDFIRLALERSKTAEEALTIICDLLAQYGQGGNCAIPGTIKITYHNSWLIADTEEAWVLETADKWWIAEKVKDVRTISNALTIGPKYDKIHPELIDYAKRKGYIKSKQEFNWKKAFTARLPDIRPWGRKGLKRHRITTNKLLENKGDINLAYMMNFLRNHNIKNPRNADKWNPSKGSFEDICLHIRPIFVMSQSTGSMVSHLAPDIQTHWVTGTSAPCTSLFKPIFIKGGLPNFGSSPNDQYDNNSLWWKHEKTHRRILQDYPTRIRIVQPDIEHYEEKWIKEVRKMISELKNQPSDEKATRFEQISEKAFQEAQALEDNWITDLDKIPVKKRSGGYLYRKLWKKENEKAGLKFRKFQTNCR